MLDFLGIGAQRAGTTWLYDRLARHPSLFLPEPKELHFWNQPKGRDLAWYRGVFATPPGVKGGEITPAYAILPDETIARVRAEFPDLRLLYLLRNPVERAWSSALMALQRAELEPDEASDQWFLDHFLSRGSTARGDYATSITAWRRHFPAEQLWIGLFDDIVAQPRAVLAAVAAHLGIDPAPFAALENAARPAPVNPGPHVAIRPQLRAFLVDLYAPRVARLGRLLGRDFSHWLA
jgi:hypothetical protein